ncbi:amidohydrolase family protein [Trujillonella endophytica]|uniref:Amidohydrolase n=1 Tax=Trujillonella endophytica TaxID=673521 RepID=A0A1H8V710_9ACTN|nr:amidohydrolase family protein [Trujillella endophytica]SEP10558.1 Amidohydrolase [Trujillella endophytica]
MTATTRRTWQQLPDPEPRERSYTVISVDDHLTEPADLFEKRFPAKLRDRAPRLVTRDDGTEAWLYKDRFYADTGLSVVAGRPREEWTDDVLNLDEMRPACWDVDRRVQDMDVDGIWASLCFPSGAWGFTGRVLSLNRDQEVGLAAIRAWNSWMIEEWHGAHPERFIPMQLPWLQDPVLAAEEVRRNAGLGFTSVSFMESPQLLKLPPITDREHWRPFFEACQETDTVISLHAGASGFVLQGSPGNGLNTQVSMFPGGAFCAAVDWTWAGIPALYPDLKIALSEGGIGWVPMAIDRLDYVTEHSAGSAAGEAWEFDISPSEALRRNFYFCMLDDPSTLDQRHLIGIDHIMFETDYPHADSTWPHSQDLLRKRLGRIPFEEASMIAGGNAARLFRHPLPSGPGWPAVVTELAAQPVP